MTTMKKLTALLLSLMLLIPFTGCEMPFGSDESSADSTVSDESGAEASTEDSAAAENEEEADTSSQAANLMQPDIPATYDSTEVDDACAKVMCDYFKAIANQDYEAYKATLNKEYFQTYNSWLVSAYNYGMESSFEMQHEVLMDTAGAKDSVIITGLSLAKVKEDESTDSIVDTYLRDYDSIIGEGFSDAIRNSCDEIMDITFTMTGICDNGEETEILKDMEMLVTIKDGVYSIIG